MNYKELKTTLEKEFKDLKLSVRIDHKDPIPKLKEGLASDYHSPLYHVLIEFTFKSKELRKVVGFVQDGELLLPGTVDIARRIIKKLI